MKLSKDFSLLELLASDYADLHGGLMFCNQLNPSEKIIDNLTELTRKVLQPLRDTLQSPVCISSGYRCSLLNKAVGGSSRSQHMTGEAADIKVAESLFNQKNSSFSLSVLKNQVFELLGIELRDSVNENFFFFASACFKINELKIDQLVHKFGKDGQPQWIHISHCKRHARGEILKVNHNGTTRLSVVEALLLGC